MKWGILTVTLLCGVNIVVIAPALLERQQPVTGMPVAFCGEQVTGGGESGQPLALRLLATTESPAQARGLDADGLRQLGFVDVDIAAVGQPQQSSYLWPRARPAWVRLRNGAGRTGGLEVVEVAKSRDALPADSQSLVIRGLVGMRVHPKVPLRLGNDSGVAVPDEKREYLLGPEVVEVMPPLLHLDREASAIIAEWLPGKNPCQRMARVFVAQGARGGVWAVRVDTADFAAR